VHHEHHWTDLGIGLLSAAAVAVLLLPATVDRAERRVERAANADWLTRSDSHAASLVPRRRRGVWYGVANLRAPRPAGAAVTHCHFNFLPTFFPIPPCPYSFF